MGILVYAIPALFPALLIDIWVTVHFRARGKDAMPSASFVIAAFTTIPLYLFLAYGWALIFSQTIDAFSGQGGIGLAVIVGFGLVCSVIRAIVGVVLYINFRHR